jgi:hypothetical protein
MNPTQRSLKKLRSEGWTVAVVEKWNPHARVRQDLFGFADLLAIRGNETIAIQTTVSSGMAARLVKIRQCKAAALWLACSSRKIVVHGWRKGGARGQRKLWQCRETLVEAVA